MPAKVNEILRIVEEIQTHSRPVIERCYQNFLLENHNAEEREYPDAADQIREILIHQNYLSVKDIEICLAYDPSAHASHANYDDIAALDQSLHDTYFDLEGAIPARAP